MSKQTNNARMVGCCVVVIVGLFLLWPIIRFIGLLVMVILIIVAITLVFGDKQDKDDT